MKNSDLMLYPSISACVMSTQIYMRDGAIYESYPSYVYSVANNMTGTYSFGQAPDMSKNLQTIRFMDFNGTPHVMDSSNAYRGYENKKITIGHYALTGANSRVSSGLGVSVKAINQMKKINFSFFRWLIASLLILHLKTHKE